VNYNESYVPNEDNILMNWAAVTCSRRNVLREICFLVSYIYNLWFHIVPTTGYERNHCNYLRGYESVISFLCIWMYYLSCSVTQEVGCFNQSVIWGRWKLKKAKRETSR